MQQSINLNDVKALCLGASILGSGGGGDPDILIDFLCYLLNKNGPLKLINPNNVIDSQLIVPIALFGAPLISAERLPNESMFTCLIQSIRTDFPSTEIVLMPAEIGGCNALTPLISASLFNLPVLDADLIGRAFPKINMCKPAVLADGPLVAYIANIYGQCRKIAAINVAELEIKARGILVEFGCSAAIATFLFNASKRDNYLIKNSLSSAIQLGNSIAPHLRPDEIQFADYVGGGIVTSVEHQIVDGYLIGKAVIQYQNKTWTVYFQNEYLALTNNDNFLAQSPNIITLLEEETLLPISSEKLRYGLRVNIFLLAAPKFWTTAQARSVVSIDKFNLSVKETAPCTQ